MSAAGVSAFRTAASSETLEASSGEVKPVTAGQGRYGDAGILYAAPTPQSPSSFEQRRQNGTAYLNGTCGLCEETRLALHGRRAEPLSEAARSAVPASFSLGPNYPDPFDPATTIAYTLKEDAFVSLRIYTLLGQEVVTLVAGAQTHGVYTVQWDGRDGAGRAVAGGTYLYRLEAGDFAQTRRMLLVK